MRGSNFLSQKGALLVFFCTFGRENGLTGPQTSIHKPENTIMSEYIVSARKYRPLTFDSVVGQGSIATTLKNAIASAKLAHAYLFCGPRGVGKTTCARIFAKTINCMSPRTDGEACGQCESCLAFQEGRSMNIHELDAASNNSVEDIRALIDQVRIPPQIGRYKVFIIDEVHMLSTAAFNAFLKTLEEPPAHAIFILATTEKHKILPTILSRCQIYDFQRMSIDNIVAHLANVAQSEGYTAEPAALNIIAQKADGGMRDALSIFDQVASYCGGNITYARTIENLNVLDYDYYFRLVDHMLARQIPEALLLFNEILGKGFDGGPFIGGLASHMRDLLVSRDPATTQLLETSDDIRRRYAEQAARCKPQWLYRAIALCNQCDMGYRTSRNKRLQVELCIIECAQATDDDGSAGRRPARILKPIFSTLAAGAASDARGNAANADTTAHHAPATSPTTPTAAAAATTTAAATATPPLTPPAAHTAATTAATRRTLRLDGLSPSLRLKPQAAASVPTAAPETTPQQPAAVRCRPIAVADFQTQWHSYAAHMPVELKAMSQRMQIMTATITVADGVTTATIPVENNTVGRQMEDIARDGLLQHLRQTLENDTLTLVFPVVARDEATHVYDKHEQLRLLCQRMPVLTDIINTFELELV